jgi:hypothetical protein
VSSPEQLTLPAPAIDPADVQALLPSLTIEQATLAAQLATVAVSAALWPTPIPDPTPEPVYAALLSASLRFGVAIEQGTAQPVVGESVGAYSYRLAAPASLASAFGLNEWEMEQLAPWVPTSQAFELDVGGRISWPADWWQSNFDNVLKAADREAA